MQTPSVRIRRFPTQTTDYLSGKVSPVGVDTGEEDELDWLYPGDVLVDDGTPLVVTEASTGRMNDGAQLFDTKTNSTLDRTNNELRRVVSESRPPLRALGYASLAIEDQQQELHLYAGRFGFEGSYISWWQESTRGAHVVEPGFSPSPKAVESDTLGMMIEALRHPSRQNETGTLKKYFRDENELGARLERFVDVIKENAERRFDSVDLEAPASDTHSPHVESDTIPTISTDQQLEIDGVTVARGDRIFLPVASETPEPISLPASTGGVSERGSFDTWQTEATHLVVLDVKQSDSGHSLEIFDATADSQFMLTGTESRTLFQQTQSDGLHLQLLARDAHVEVIGVDAPNVYSIHVYRIASDEFVDRSFLISIGHHDTDTPLLEHPLALDRHSYSSGEEVVDVLSTPQSSILSGWSDGKEDVEALAYRVANVFQETLSERV